ncbi:response regulator transcription factor [Paenibacillus sediminis]|uniref:Two-component system response regulator YesN n=1 Tax=Paenibacillus sediminis TaxID=664909 RepID=A0ABS4H392_9BACL|nr:response regulator transcription factor [Paenibacillus sediminis]MBP1937003.1 two-component system response regulator YesN [Paenibacillus sediminis]
MRVLIVDDEPLVRIGIKSAIEWEANGMHIVGEAADGIEALRLMMEQKPDVVILDIKMPKKDGLDVLLEMREKGIQAKVIILSSFDDFTFVKKAMQLGAVDYFHKPSMNEQEMTSVLRKIKDELERDQMSQGEIPGHKSESRDKEVVLRQMLSGHIDGAHLTKLKEGNMYVLLFTIGKYSQILKRYTKENASILPNTIANILSELLSKEKEVEFVQIEDNLFSVIISHSESKSAQASFTRVNDFILLINSSLKRFVNIDTFFGVSEPFQSFHGMKQAVSQAKQALEQKFYHPEDYIFYFKNRHLANEQTLEQLNAYIVAMKNGLKDEKYDEFARNLTEWEQFLRKYECMSEKDVKKIYEGLIFMMEDGEEYLEYRNKLEEIDDFNECSAFYHKVFGDTLKCRYAVKNKDYSPLIRNILQYIEKNYKEDISLNSLGEQFHASPNYISRLFKQEVGRGLFTYLNEIRIQKAKELLKNYQYKIYEVAEMVGFNSQVHFAIVFNKFVGMSPKDYRKETV